MKVVSVGKHIDGEPLFSDVTLVLGPGDRIGLVGPNGVGKSTLLRILTGAQPPSTGQVTRAPGTTIGYFAQQVPDPAATVGGFLAEGLGELHRLAGRLRVLEQRLTAEPRALAEYGELQDRWATLDGWRAAARLTEVRQRLDIDHLADEARLHQISGGEQARLTLARVLLDTPDLLILDEPTNHLDAAGIAWLGTWLADFTGGILVASHDRAFLDRTVTQIIELDGIHDQPQTYPGGYTDYRAEKTRRWQRLLLDYEAQEKDRRRWAADIDRTREQARGVELAVRSGLGADQQRRYAKKVAKKAKVRERRLRRQMDSIRWLSQPQTRPQLALAFPDQATPDTPALHTHDLAVTLGGRTLLHQVDLVVHAGDRILLTGPNGTGKTTLMRVLAGQLAPDSGTVTATAPVALLPQTHDTLRDDATSVLDHFRAHVPVYADDAERLLDGYLFGPDQWRSPLRTLSAGELRRLLLAVLVNSPAQVLLLDEPTNYLDFESMEVVEEALRAFRGTVLMASHDAYFADAVGPTRRWHLNAGRVVEESH